jgi:hypothetical protein
MGITPFQLCGSANAARANNASSRQIVQTLPRLANLNHQTIHGVFTLHDCANETTFRKYGGHILQTVDQKIHLLLLQCDFKFLRPERLPSKQI